MGKLPAGCEALLSREKIGQTLRRLRLEREDLVIHLFVVMK